jgi:hypothetical protein
VEVDTPSAMIGIDATGQGLLGIGPVFDPILEDTRIDLVETLVIDEEGVILHLDVVDAWFSKLEDDALVQPDRDEWNALMLQNVADLADALEQLRQQGYPVQSEDAAHLSAYMTEHLQRFGEYTLKRRPVAPLSDQEKTFTDSHSEQSEDSEEISA